MVGWKSAISIAVVTASCLVASVTSAKASGAVGETDCSKQLPRLRKVGNTDAGPTQCRMIVNTVRLDGKEFTRIDVGLDGTVDGIVAESGNYHEYLTNSPDLVFPQAGNNSQRHFGIATYEGAKGAAMTILLPANAAGWNNKMWVMVHGRGRSFKGGSLKAWDKLFDPAAPIADLDLYDRNLMKKGYAVVKTYRTSAENEGEIQTRLDDGRVVDWASFNDNTKYIIDFAIVAQNLTKTTLGHAPRLTYQWGHSAGARISRDLNYTPGLNRGPDGKLFFAGVLADDPASGTWLPFVMRDGRDMLFATAADKKDFVPQIEVQHGAYNNITTRVDQSAGSLMSQSYLANKRANNKMMLEKGLGDKFRAYEIRGISHQGGEIVGETHYQNMPLANLMDRFFDMLDNWVERGVIPPPSRSDWSPVGQVTETGDIKYPALALPEAACPLGVYYPWPRSVAGNMRFAPFNGKGIEPLDEGKQFVDLNRNGVWDFVETPTEAWRRLGLIGKTESLTSARYVECVSAAARSLREGSFMSAEKEAEYVRRAQSEKISPDGAD